MAHGLTTKALGVVAARDFDTNDATDKDTDMASWRKAFPSKFLQAADLDTAITATIDRVAMESVAKDEPSKLVVHFREPNVKGCVLNLTRAEAITDVAGTDNTDEWSGTVVQLVKGTTRYQGKKVDCITVQKPLVASEVGF